MPVLVTTRALGGGPGLAASTVRRRAERMLAAAGAPRAELSVLLCDDRTIAELNRRFRGKDGATDVLSFPMAEGEGAAAARRAAVLGDVVVSIPTAARQAGRGPGALREEVARLVAHGLLHLLGWTHGSARELARMERETDRLVEASRGGRAAPTRRPPSAG